MFTAWAGVSPKRFLQLLTIEHARSRLAAAPDLASAADAVGLSGSGRLHDLYVTLEALTPGDERAGGRGLDIEYGGFYTAFGRCFMARTSRGICSLHFDDDHAPLIEDLRARWPDAKIHKNQILISAFGATLLAPLENRPKSPVAVLVKGTNLQVQVWRALLALPSGAVTSYASLAQQVGRQSAVRAVANAVGANPVAWLIPCHRVIRSTGELGGYRWGLERKRLLLGWESAHGADQAALRSR